MIKNTSLPILAVLLVFLPNCKKTIELKQDSPQSTVATFIKMYANNNFENIDSIVDLLHERSSARDGTCFSDFLLGTKCIMDQDKCPSCPIPDECVGHEKKHRLCLCDGDGKKKADSIRSFKSTAAFRGLSKAGFLSGKCSVNDVFEIKFNQTKVYAISLKSSCEDLSAEKFSIVDVSCGESRIKFILRKKEDKWFMMGPVDRSGLPYVPSPEEEAKEKRLESEKENRRKDLNKDMNLFQLRSR